MIEPAHVQISAVEKVTDDLMKDGSQGSSLCILFQEGETLCQYPGDTNSIKVTAHRCKPCTPGKLFGGLLKVGNFAIDGSVILAHHVFTSWVILCLSLNHYTTWRYFFLLGKIAQFRYNLFTSSWYIKTVQSI